MVTNVTFAASPDRGECAMVILGVILAGCFLVNSGHFCGRGATFWCKNPLLRPNNFTYSGSFNENKMVGYQRKTCWIPWRAERAILGVILAGRLLANSGYICGQGSHFVM